jgi:hypothetical protein
MANLFNTDNALTSEPTEFTVGSLVQWKRSDLAEDYPPASYDLIYKARLRGGLNPEMSVTATNSNGVFLVTLSSAVTAVAVPGDYYWQAEIERKSDNARILIAKGQWRVIPDLDQSGADPRSHAEVMLDKIQSLLEGRADKDVTSYSINGRSIAKMNITDLLSWRDYYRREVNLEKRKADAAAGKPSTATVKVRFL